MYKNIVYRAALLLFCLADNALLQAMHTPSTLKELTVQKVAHSASKIYQAQGWEALEKYLSPVPQDIQEVFSTLIYSHVFDETLAQQILSLYINQGWEKAKKFFENLPYEPSQRLTIQGKIIAALTQQLPDEEENLTEFNQILALIQHLLTLIDLKAQLIFAELIQVQHHAEEIEVNESIQRIITRILQNLTQELNKNRFIQAFPAPVQQHAQALLQTDPQNIIITLLKFPHEQALQILEYLVFDYGIENKGRNQQAIDLLNNLGNDNFLK